MIPPFPIGNTILQSKVKLFAPSSLAASITSSEMFINTFVRIKTGYVPKIPGRMIAQCVLMIDKFFKIKYSETINI